jgi:hypothetical protein
MLLRFQFANHRSFRDPAELSFLATRLEDHDHRRMPSDSAKHGVLPVLALYGANASGKSNVLDALRRMFRHIVASHREGRPSGGVHYEPFGLPRHEAPSSFACDVVLEGVRYHYGFTLNEHRYEEEWLHAWPSGSKQVWFDRRGADRSQWYFGPSLQGQKVRIAELTRDNSLFLAAAAQNNHPQLAPLHAWFEQAFAPSMSMPRHERLAFDDSPLFAPHNRERLLHLLRAADLGVVDLRVESRRSQFESIYRREFADAADPEAERRVAELFGDADPKVLVLGHAGADGRVSWLTEDQESTGTVTLINLLHAMFTRLDAGGVVCVDELDRALHPDLCAALLTLFTSKAGNPAGTQLLFTTHDQSLLAHLRRDEIVMVEKQPDGASVLVPLTDYAPRKRDDLQRSFSEGRYGGVPMLGQFSLLSLAPG